MMCLDDFYESGFSPDTHGAIKDTSVQYPTLVRIHSAWRDKGCYYPVIDQKHLFFLAQKQLQLAVTHRGIVARPIVTAIKIAQLDVADSRTHRTSSTPIAMKMPNTCTGGMG